MSKRMLRPLISVLLTGLVLGNPPAFAGTVTVSGDDPKASLEVTVAGASVADVLAELHEKFGFEVDDMAHASPGDAFDARLSGNLVDIIQRLLRNRNHVIVRSADSASGIERVVIINENVGKAASQTKQDKAALQQIENNKRATGE